MSLERWSTRSTATPTQEAFRCVGHEFGYDEIRSQIGKGGDQLMPAFLSEDQIEAFDDQIEVHRSNILKGFLFPDDAWIPQSPQLFEKLMAQASTSFLPRPPRRTSSVFTSRSSTSRTWSRKRLRRMTLTSQSRTPTSSRQRSN